MRSVHVRQNKRGKSLFGFIFLLRILALILITDFYYEAIYPVSAIANGGFLGVVVFFAISGFCLYPVKQAFPKWIMSAACVLIAHFSR